MALLESAVRDDLNGRALRVSAVLDPVRVVITNYPEDQIEQLTAVNNPENEADGSHTVEFRYDNAGYRLGLKISLAALFLVIACYLVQYRPWDKKAAQPV